ncbi:hypothetical protein OG21DRAFT_627601 [Imleria badia]|nr:hypothetical protein OG21DRAFT_627601 [Imleria badia]
MKHKWGRGANELCEQPDTPYAAARDPTHVQVDPDGHTGDNQNEGDACKSESKACVGEVRRTFRDVQGEVGRSGARRTMSTEGERGSALVHTRSTTTTVEDDQRNEGSDEDVPEGSPTPPASLDVRTNQSHVPQNFELEGERRLVASSEETCNDDERDATGTSRDVNDAIDVSTKLPNTSERVSKRSEQDEEENSPKKAPDELEELKRDITPRSDSHTIREGPRDVENEHDGNRNTPC